MRGAQLTNLLIKLHKGEMDVKMCVCFGASAPIAFIRQQNSHSSEIRITTRLFGDTTRGRGHCALTHPFTILRSLTVRCLYWRSFAHCRSTLQLSFRGSQVCLQVCFFLSLRKTVSIPIDWLDYHHSPLTSIINLFLAQVGDTLGLFFSNPTQWVWVWVKILDSCLSFNFHTFYAMASRISFVVEEDDDIEAIIRCRRTGVRYIMDSDCLTFYYDKYHTSGMSGNTEEDQVDSDTETIAEDTIEHLLFVTYNQEDLTRDEIVALLRSKRWDDDFLVEFETRIEDVADHETSDDSSN